MSTITRPMSSGILAVALFVAVVVGSFGAPVERTGSSAGSVERQAESIVVLDKYPESRLELMLFIHRAGLQRGPGGRDASDLSARAVESAVIGSIDLHAAHALNQGERAPEHIHAHG